MGIQPFIDALGALDPAHILAGLGIGDVQDGPVVLLPVLLQPLPDPSRARVVGRQRHALRAKFIEELPEIVAPQADVQGRFRQPLLRDALDPQQLRLLQPRGRHELHEPQGADAAFGVLAEGAFREDDAAHQIGVQVEFLRRGEDLLLIRQRVLGAQQGRAGVEKIPGEQRRQQRQRQQRRYEFMVIDPQFPGAHRTLPSFYLPVRQGSRCCG